VKKFIITAVLVLLAATLLPIQAAFAAGPLEGKTIALDAGHGGTDPGAVNEHPDFGVYEKDMTRAAAESLKKRLEKDGAQVAMVRKGDETLSLQERVVRANASGADVLISIHHNSAGPAVNGTESFYSQADDKQVAEAMQRRLVKRLGLTDRGVKHSSDFVLTNRPNMPSTITEASFLTNDEEAHGVKYGDRIERHTKALHEGLIDYFSAE
jgi:N-acetylmuramoyl-L-alanine amidase